jgi:hypothetical protein
MTEMKLKYITFEQAKWLKEKRFDAPTKAFYDLYNNPNNKELSYSVPDNWNDCKSYSAPEQWQVVEWLRVNHGIWVGVSINGLNKLFTSDIHNYKQKGSLGNIQNGGYESPQEAYSATFDYIKDNNLI